MIDPARPPKKTRSARQRRRPPNSSGPARHLCPTSAVALRCGARCAQGFFLHSFDYLLFKTLSHSRRQAYACAVGNHRSSLCNKTLFTFNLDRRRSEKVGGKMAKKSAVFSDSINPAGARDWPCYIGVNEISSPIDYSYATTSAAIPLASGCPLRIYCSPSAVWAAGSRGIALLAPAATLIERSARAGEPVSAAYFVRTASAPRPFKRSQFLTPGRRDHLHARQWIWILL